MPQSLSSILIHLVFSTKNRQPMITEPIESELYKYLATIFRRCDCPSLLIGGDKDHVHSLFAMSRNCSMAQVVKEVKTSSSKWIKGKGMGFNTSSGNRDMEHSPSDNLVLKISKSTFPFRRCIIVGLHSRTSLDCYV
jgi:REP element-mobilizing transposase RayT